MNVMTDNLAKYIGLKKKIQEILYIYINILFERVFRIRRILVKEKII